MPEPSLGNSHLGPIGYCCGLTSTGYILTLPPDRGCVADQPQRYGTEQFHSYPLLHVDALRLVSDTAAIRRSFSLGFGGGVGMHPSPPTTPQTI
jgi:hypothetical protein